VKIECAPDTIRDNLHRMGFVMSPGEAWSLQRCLPHPRVFHHFDQSAMLSARVQRFVSWTLR